MVVLCGGREQTTFEDWLCGGARSWNFPNTVFPGRRESSRIYRRSGGQRDGDGTGGEVLNGHVQGVIYVLFRKRRKEILVRDVLKIET